LPGGKTEQLAVWEELFVYELKPVCAADGDPVGTDRRDGWVIDFVEPRGAGLERVLLTDGDEVDPVMGLQVLVRWIVVELRIGDDRVDIEIGQKFEEAGKEDVAEDSRLVRL
jgi:hypothetical protein